MHERRERQEKTVLGRSNVQGAGHEDEDGGGGSVLGLLSYLWMFIALALFAYLITTVQNQAGIIKVLKRRVATMESRLGLQPLSMDL